MTTFDQRGQTIKGVQLNAGGSFEPMTEEISPLISNILDQYDFSIVQVLSGGDVMVSITYGPDFIATVCLRNADNSEVMHKKLQKLSMLPAYMR